MEIIQAENSGFCFGVKNAVDRAIELSASGEKVYTLGPLIHNRDVVEKLKAKGIEVIDSIEAAAEGVTVIIRSHGIGKEEYKRLEETGAKVFDATCVNVKRIHSIVAEKMAEGYGIIIVGDKNHPEVKGINGWCNYNAVIADNAEEIIPLIGAKVCIVAQTTFNKEKWYEVVCKLLRHTKEVLVYNTICNTTEIRQNEIEELSKKVDAVIIVGGKESSNTRKLYEISSKNCKKVFLVENSEDLNYGEFKEYNKIGIAGGASTPDYIIKEVVKKLSTVENERNERNEKVAETKLNNMNSQNKEDIIDYFADYNDIHPGCIVEGKIIKVNEKELFVDICYKSDGILPIEEASHMPVNLKEKYNVGDTFEAKVLRMNDGEGNVLLSRKEMENEEFVAMLNKYKEEGTQIEVSVNSLNKGGYSCSYGELSVFIPLSQSGLSRNDNQEELVGKKIMVKILDINRKRNTYELVASRKDIVRAEANLRKKAFVEGLNEGDLLKGTVKAFIPSGAFVSLGDVDAFIPVSEISWRRIGKPQDVLAEGSLVQFVVIRLDKQEMKVTGSIKRSGKEPWEDFMTRFKENDVIDVKVARFAEFGVFVEIIDGVDGLIHISNLSEQRVNKPQDVVKAGEVVKARIVKIDTESKKVSLSLKDADKPVEEAAEPETSEN